MRKFYNFVNESGGDRVLYITGEIVASENLDNWFYDRRETIAKDFKDELGRGSGPLTVFINSPGGDVFAGFEIYNALKEYPFPVRVSIDSLCASIASVVAMAGEKISMSPAALLLIHNPWGSVTGESKTMLHYAEVLDELRDSLVKIYQNRTGLSRGVLVSMCDEETWMSADKALGLGFIDEIAYETPRDAGENAARASFLYSRKTSEGKFAAHLKKPRPVLVNDLYARLDKHLQR